MAILESRAESRILQTLLDWLHEVRIAHVVRPTRPRIDTTVLMIGIFNKEGINVSTRFR